MTLRETAPFGDKASGVRHLVVASSVNPLAKAMLASLHLEGVHVERDLIRSEALARDAADSKFIYPKLVFARVLMRKRKVLLGLQLWVRSWIEAVRIRRANPCDPRLDLLPMRLQEQAGTRGQSGEPGVRNPGSGLAKRKE